MIVCPICCGAGNIHSHYSQDDYARGYPRSFLGYRMDDPTGVSGTGIVFYGVQFPNGKCVIVWNTGTSSVAVFDSVDDVRTVHGHSGSTVINFYDEMEVKHNE